MELYKNCTISERVKIKLEYTLFVGQNRKILDD